MKDGERLVQIIFLHDSGCSMEYAQTLAKTISDNGYRLDPYPDGKTKQELLKIIDEKQTKIDRAKALLREVTEQTEIKKFLNGDD